MQCFLLPPTPQYLVDTFRRNPIVASQVQHACPRRITSTDFFIADSLPRGSLRLRQSWCSLARVEVENKASNCIFKGRNKAAICSEGMWQPVPHRGLDASSVFEQLGYAAQRMILETYIEELFRSSEATGSEMTEYLDSERSSYLTNVVIPA